MRFVYLGLNWSFGVLFLLVGLLALTDTILGALCLISISAFLLPPVRNFIYTKTRRTFPVKARAIVIVALMGIFGTLMAEVSKEKEVAIAEQHKKETAEKL